jgi:hypothetical protein
VRGASGGARHFSAWQYDTAAVRRTLAKHKIAVVEIVAFAFIGRQTLRIFIFFCNLCAYLARLAKPML